MESRRNFLKNLTQAGIALPFSMTLADNISRYTWPETRNEPDWNEIRSHFLASSNDLVHLNSGSSGNMPLPVLNFYKEKLMEVNAFAPYHVLNKWKPEIKSEMARLASMIGAGAGELAFVRNTTEAINIILWGLQLERNDEIVNANWDYPLVNFSLERLEEQKGVRSRTVQVPLSEMSDEDIVKAYESMINENTRLLIVTWMTHKEGRILPARDICRMADRYGIEVLVDGAHIAGQLDFSLTDVGCHYFASSLHKWLNAPLGSGLLYINTSAMDGHEPILSYDKNIESPSVRYEHLGTRAFQNMATLKAALDYLELTGIKKKEERLTALTHRWMDAVSGTDGIQICTPRDKCCAVASMAIKGLSSGKIKSIMNKEYGLHVKSTGYAGLPMIPISPNIFTSFEEIDRLSEAAISIAKSY